MKKLNIIKLTLTLIAIVCAAGWAAAQSFELMPVDNVEQGQRFRVAYRMTNVEASLPEPPQLKGCTFYAGPNTSTSVSMVSDGRGTRTTQTVTVSYIYIANTVGSVTIPPVTVNAGGKKLTARGATFKVLPAESRPQQQQAQPSRQPGMPATPAPQGSNSAISPSDFQIRVTFSKSKVYEMEAVIASIKIYTRHEFNVPTVLEQPVFEGFLSEELEPSQQVSRESLNGQIYYAIEIKRCLLYPQKAGDLTITAGRYDVPVLARVPVSAGFFTTYSVQETRVTTPRHTATIHVTPLPQPQPEGFSGAVGKFSISTELTPNAELLRTNEAATYSYIIKGTGDIKFLRQPELTFPSDFDAYTPKTDIDTHIQGADMAGTYRVDYPIVPQQTGKYEIGGQNYVYFDPSAGKYVTLSTPVYKVNVVRGSGVTGEASAAASADAVMKDIRHIHSLAAGTSAAPSPVFGKLWYWLCYIAVAGALVAVIIIYRRHVRLEADVKGRRLARANRVAARRFKAAAAFMKARNSEKFYLELATALKGYLSDKLDIPTSQLITDNIATRLSEYGATDETAQKVIDVLNDCEMARFTPSASDVAMHEMLDRASEAIKEIEDVKTKTTK